MKIFYKTRATATGGRSGHAALDDGSLAFDLAAPGTGTVGTNPEQLFGIGQNKEGGFSLDVDLYVHILGLSDSDADRLVETTHQICPYSNALRSNVDVRLHVTTA